MCREKGLWSCGRHQDISLGAGRCSGVFVTHGHHASPPQCSFSRPGLQRKNPSVMGISVMSVKGHVGGLRQ